MGRRSVLFSTLKVTSAPTSRSSMLSMFSTTTLRSRIFGSITCWRLKARSWRGERRAAQAGFLDFLGEGVRRPGHAVVGEQEVAIAVDDEKNIVEVVGDATGQPADRFHLLDLHHLALQPFPLAHFGVERLVRFMQLRGAFADAPFQFVVEPAHFRLSPALGHEGSAQFQVW